MCSEANCSHVKYDPNSRKTLGDEEQAALWASIKATRKAMTEHTAFLAEIGGVSSEDPQMIKLEAMTKSLWARFRVL